MESKTNFASYLWISASFVVFISCNVAITDKINQEQPTPYLDEVFHVPQSLAYFDGNYSYWDDKITTLPGLYCGSNLIVKFAELFGIKDFSKEKPTAAVYRSINVIINGLNFWCIYALLNLRENDSMNALQKAFATLTLSLFPLHYFFSFLFYTDPMSTFFILHMIISTKTNRNKMAAFSGLCAVLTRQTNIIWVVWNCTVTTWDICKDFVPVIEKIILNLFPRAPEDQHTKGSRSKSSSKPTTATTKDLLRLWMLCCRKVLPKLYGHAIVLFLFIMFVLVNGGIVVGDKNAHKATINIPQIFYFTLFYAFFTFPVILLNLKRLVFSLRNHLILFIFLTIFGLLIVNFNTQVHPYLLADNRHYPFYIWKRVYEWFPVTKYCLVPIYIVLAFHICLDCAQHPALTCCTISLICAALVPQLLLEFRYFIIPYFLLRITSSSLEWKHLIAEFLLYLGVNYMTINLFLYKPFVWAHTNETQRFMW